MRNMHPVGLPSAEDKKAGRRQRARLVVAWEGARPADAALVAPGSRSGNRHTPGVRLVPVGGF
ncbi:MAG: hypothetical protein PVJ07_02240 [Anaerolineales bacterium]